MIHKTLPCLAVYYASRKNVQIKTNQQCSGAAEWSVEWRVPPTDGVGGPSRHHMEVCRHHIIQAYAEAMKSGAVAGQVYLLGVDQRDSWDINPA